MGALGADVDALRDLAGSMRRSSQRIDEITVRLDRRTRGTRWPGADGERFRREWVLRHRPELAALGARCRRLATDLDRQADDQRRASRADPATPPSLAAPPALTLPRSSTSAGLPEVPRTERRFHGGIELTVGFVAAQIDGDVWLQQLDGGRTRVVVSETNGLGLVAGVGATASFSVGDHQDTTTPTTGAQASAEAHLAGVTRRSWVVPDGEIDELLAQVAAVEVAATVNPRLGLPRADGTTPIGGEGSASAARTLGGLFDGVVERLTGFDPGVDDRLGSLATLRAPGSIESLVEVEASLGLGGALLGLSGPAAHGSAGGTLRAGRGISASSRSTIVEYSGGLAETLSTSLGDRLGVPIPGGDRAVVGVRLELVEPRDGRSGADGHLLARVSHTRGSDLVETVMSVDLTAGPPDLGDALRGVVDRLGSGDVPAALRSLATQSATTAWADRVTSRTTTAAVSGTTLRGSGEVGTGLTAGISARGKVVHVDRTG